LDLSKISLIQSIANKGSISAAAAERYISPVAAREQLGVVENELGFSLFVRTKQGVTLTPEGSHFLKHASQLALEFDELVSECRSLAGEAGEAISIAVYEPYGLFRYCNTYSKLYPRTVFSYFKADFSNAVRPAAFMKKFKIDIMQEPYNPLFKKDGLRFLPVSKDYCCAYCMRSHPLASKKSIPISMLKDQKVYFAESVSYEGTILEANLRKAGVYAVSVPYDEMNVLELCGKGDIYLLESEMRSSFQKLECIPLEPVQPFIHGVVYADDAPEKVLNFINYLQKSVGEEQLQLLTDRCSEMDRAYENDNLIVRSEMDRAHEAKN